MGRTLYKIMSIDVEEKIRHATSTYSKEEAEQIVERDNHFLPELYYIESVVIERQPLVKKDS